MPNIPSMLPNQANLRKTNVVPAWLVGFVLLALPFTPVAFAQTVVKQVAAAESQPKVIPFPLAEGRPGVPSVLEAPRHGSLVLGNGQSVYTPAKDFMGRDSFLVDFPSSNGSRVVRYQVRVLPRYIPLTTASGADQAAPALYESWSRSFILCDPPVFTPEDPTLNCRRLPTRFVPPGNHFPIVWPQTNGLDLLALYDQETGLLYFLEFHNGYLEVRDAINLAPMTGGWPVVGDWDASGQSELAMVFDDGRVFVLSPSSWQQWPQTLEVQIEDETSWPLAIHHLGSPSSLAFVSAIHGSYSWLACGPTVGCSRGRAKSYARFDFRRPIWFYGTRFLLMLDSSLQLVPGSYSLVDPDPQTIPVKFPDDPIGGGGGGGG